MSTVRTTVPPVTTPRNSPRKRNRHSGHRPGSPNPGSSRATRSARSSAGTLPVEPIIGWPESALVRTPDTSGNTKRLRTSETRMELAPTAITGLMAMAALAAGLLAMVFVYTIMGQGAFTLNALRHESAQLSEKEDALGRSLAHYESPKVLAKSAVRLGLVPSEVPVFMRLSDGKIFGDPGLAAAASKQSQPGF
jgi:hypothetical protein